MGKLALRAFPFIGLAFLAACSDPAGLNRSPDGASIQTKYQVVVHALVIAGRQLSAQGWRQIKRKIVWNHANIALTRRQ